MTHQTATLTLPKRTELSRLLRFMVVGASGTMADFATLTLLKELAGLPTLIANTLSFSVGLVNNFTWNRLWTFPESKVRKKRTQLMQFATINGIGLALNNLIVLAVTAVLMPHLGETLSPNLAKAFAIGIVLFWNFGGNRLWTYRGL